MQSKSYVSPAISGEKCLLFINAPLGHWHSWICLHLKFRNISHNYNSFPDLQEHIWESMGMLSNPRNFSSLILGRRILFRCRIRKSFWMYILYLVVIYHYKELLYFQVTTKMWYIFIKIFFVHPEILTIVISRNNNQNGNWEIY